MPWVIKSKDDQAMADAHLEWAKRRAKREGIEDDDPQVGMLGIIVWKHAFLAGMEYGRKSNDHSSNPTK